MKYVGCFQAVHTLSVALAWHGVELAMGAKYGRFAVTGEELSRAEQSIGADLQEMHSNGNEIPCPPFSCFLFTIVTDPLFPSQIPFNKKLLFPHISLNCSPRRTMPDDVGDLW